MEKQALAVREQHRNFSNKCCHGGNSSGKTLCDNVFSLGGYHSAIRIGRNFVEDFHTAWYTLYCSILSTKGKGQGSSGCMKSREPRRVEH